MDYRKSRMSAQLALLNMRNNYVASFHAGTYNAVETTKRTRAASKQIKINVIVDHDVRQLQSIMVTRGDN